MKVRVTDNQGNIWEEDGVTKVSAVNQDSYGPGHQIGVITPSRGDGEGAKQFIFNPSNIMSLVIMP